MNEQEYFEKLYSESMKSQQVQDLIKEQGLEAIQESVRFRAFYDSHFHKQILLALNQVVPSAIEDLLKTVNNDAELIGFLSGFFSSGMAIGAFLYRDWLSTFGIDIISIDKQALDKQKEGSDGLT